MAQQKEIEIKWRTPGLSRQVFKRAIEHYFSDVLHTKFRFKNGRGDDVYYRHGGVLRHRVSSDCHELTAKGRVSFDSIKVRHEINLKLDESVNPFDVACLLKMLKFKPAVSIYKDCDIYFADIDGAEVQVVWYKVRRSESSGPWRRFVEVEIANVAESRSIKILDQWAAIVEKMFDLTPMDRSDLSLYEIYSGKRYAQM